MTPHLLDLPNEILEVIAFHVIDGEWRNDVDDFLSLTSTCRRLQYLSHEERYWQKMVSRRDPTEQKPAETVTWLDYCKQIYRMRTILSTDLKDTISRYNENYFCTIEKILLWPNKIRIYIDERGDYSLGHLQDPTTTRIAFAADEHADFYKFHQISPHNSLFLIADIKSQYLGYLDFSVDFSLDHVGQLLCFQYGYSGYTIIKLFHLEQAFLDRHNLFPLLNACQKKLE